MRKSTTAKAAKFSRDNQESCLRLVTNVISTIREELGKQSSVVLLRRRMNADLKKFRKWTGNNASYDFISRRWEDWVPMVRESEATGRRISVAFSSDGSNDFFAVQLSDEEAESHRDLSLQLRKSLSDDVADTFNFLIDDDPASPRVSKEEARVALNINDDNKKKTIEYLLDRDTKQVASRTNNTNSTMSLPKTLSQEVAEEFNSLEQPLKRSYTVTREQARVALDTVVDDKTNAMQALLGQDLERFYQLPAVGQCPVLQCASEGVWIRITTERIRC